MIMISVLVSSAVDRGFRHWSDQTNNYTISMGCFTAKHEAFTSQSKDGLARKQDKVLEWRDMHTRELLCQ